MREVLSSPMFAGLMALLALVVALVTVAPTWLSWRRPRQPKPVPGQLTVNQLEELLEELSSAVRRQWREQLPKLGVDPVAKLAVRPGWTENVEAVSPNLDVVFDGAIGGRVQQLHLEGRATTTAAADFVTLPSRQLVILGEAGAGKSILAGLLARDLQTHRTHLDGKVPVVFIAAGWHPEHEPLLTWMARSLAVNYGIPDATARQIIDTGHVMPIVDGLDECTSPATAMRRLHAWAQNDTPFIVTCRNRPFRDAHADHGPLARAAVVELRPLLPDDVMTYLDPHREPRWAAVRSRVLADGSDPLAVALSSPLMVGLARHRYRSTHPDELLSLGDRGTIESVLIDQFVPMAFNEGMETTGSRESPSPDDADRWLRFLANHLRRRRTTLIAWWELHLTNPHQSPFHVPRLTAASTGPRAWWSSGSLVMGLIPGIYLGFIVGSMAVGQFGWLNGLGIGLATATVVGLMCGVWIEHQARSRKDTTEHPASDPVTAYRIDRRHTRFIILTWSTGPILGLATGVGFGLDYRWQIGLSFGLTVGLLTTMVFAFRTIRPHSPEKEPPVPANVDPAMSDYLTGQYSRFGVIVVLAIGLTSWLGGGMTLALGLGLSALPAGLLLGLTPGLIGLLLAGSMVYFPPRLRSAFDAADAAQQARLWRLAFADLASTAWLRHQLTRRLLHRQGRLPADVIGFLQLAHERGVLRQAGVHYQFRHILLQEHLADKPQESAD
ncbi:NACHT domain-containing protein [Stackebrandtia endophytica]|uniref:NACHT domain-containing protein n=1 Tax=Stackebrandtia endophytica TaxID=1496996 RepID=A0A543AUX4_9ACTN|nr:NACHT domain-containing protein [Stackebrandtia endophytica]TQL76341.1 NACHT domain-containing protein [Stackebrandtia endophytica]